MTSFISNLLGVWASTNRGMCGERYTSGNCKLVSGRSPYTIIRSKFVNSTGIQKEALFQWPEISLIPNSRCGIYVLERDGMFTIECPFFTYNVRYGLRTGEVGV